MTPVDPGRLEPLPVRLLPGDDLRARLQAIVGDRGIGAAFVLSGIGSLSRAKLRFAGRREARDLAGAYEIVSLSGTLSRDGAHLHAALSDEEGRVVAGHVGSGCIVRTTAEVLIVALPGWTFRRAHDDATGYSELTPVPQPH